MPLWQFFHPEDAFTDQDKLEIAERVTEMYAPMLPRFYVNVVFQTVPRASYYIGGEPADDFVRVLIDHIARTMDDDEIKRRFLDGATTRLGPYIGGRGLRWELSVDETPRDLWTIDGLVPPPTGSAAEATWKAENTTSPYEE